MKKKIVSIMLTAAMTATLLAGCGSTAEAPATAPAAEEAAPAAEEAAPATEEAAPAAEAATEEAAPAAAADEGKVLNIQ